MELTVNSFTKGMLKDTHPMMLGTESLTDALNATLVTMNGNEVILQNDMGNIKVDSAVLPPGYEPVGIKEYGGIIYVASYNPITNMSLLGSFPSPLRIFNDVLREGSGTIEELEEYFINDNDDYIYSDSKIIPLTNYPLRAGDKFIICTDYDLNGKVTNYNNYDSRLNRIESKKNKLFTLFAGVTNSQNEFVDITKTLVRWDTTTGNIINTDNLSENHKFNSGYFIRKSTYNSNQNSFSLPTSDSDYNSNKELKQKLLEANSYSYKLVSPLYLKIQLNHIQDFTYNIYALKENKTINETNYIEYTFYVESHIKYNCPEYSSILGREGVLSSSSHIIPNWNNITQIGKLEKLEELSDNIYTTISSDDYSFLFSNTRFTDCFDFFILELSEYFVVPESTTHIASYVDSQDKNLICSTITKKYKVLRTLNNNEILFTTNNSNEPVTINIEDDTIRYSIKVFGLNYNNKTYYIKNLSIEDRNINLLKINSGVMELTDWRFFNNYDNKSGTIVYYLNSYPEYGYEFLNLLLDLLDITVNTKETNASDRIIHITGLTCYNGRNELKINWEEKGLLPNVWYRAKLKYKKVLKLSNINNISDILTPTTTSGNNTIPMAPTDILENLEQGYNLVLDEQFYLTTELFNDNFNEDANNENYAYNYGKLLYQSEGTPHPIKEKLNIDPIYILDKQTGVSGSDIPVREGQLYYTTNTPSSINYSESYNKTILNKVNSIIINFESNGALKLYPSWVYNPINIQRKLSIKIQLLDLLENLIDSPYVKSGNSNYNESSLSANIAFSGNNSKILTTAFTLLPSISCINELTNSLYITLQEISVTNVLKTISLLDSNSTLLSDILFGNTSHKFAILPDLDNGGGGLSVVFSKDYPSGITPINFDTSYAYRKYTGIEDDLFEDIESDAWNFIRDRCGRASCYFMLSKRSPGDNEYFGKGNTIDRGNGYDKYDRNNYCRVFWKLNSDNSYGIINTLFGDENVTSNDTIKASVKSWFTNIFSKAVIYSGSGTTTPIYIPKLNDQNDNNIFDGYPTFNTIISAEISDTNGNNTGTAETITKTQYLKSVLFNILNNKKELFKEITLVESSYDSIKATIEGIETSIECAYVGNNIVLTKDKDGIALSSSNVYKLSGSELENKSDGILRYKDGCLVFNITDNKRSLSEDWLYDRYTAVGAHIKTIKYNKVFVIPYNLSW